MTARPIQKVLIANRGEIARRIIRTCRQMGIATVAVCSDTDRDAPFVLEADEFVPLGGRLPAESYLRMDAVLEAARRSGSDAIHPGYGFLSENAAFARACEEANFVFIGPPAEVIAAMGSKIEAKSRMSAADVPLLPSVEVDDRSIDEILRQAEPLGWPLLVKASFGGGGRGMRIVRKAAEFASLVETARREAHSAFGDGRLFVEPYVEPARHVEIQILGDAHGNLVHLFERECSIQRRHQKVIEESPSPALGEPLRREIIQAALRAGKAIGYVNAGTVEFLLTPDGKFYFLEVNTRLQVEHPVTEFITGLDLVRLQILVAMGESLPPEAHQATMQGHAIEARLYAEDPRQDYLPSAGALHRLAFPVEPGLRIDSAVEETALVSPYYDPMLAKVIVHAATRAEAARRLSDVLARAHIHGLRTNRELLVRTLRHPDFLAGETDTAFLERHDPALMGAPLADEHAERLHAAAAALVSQARRRSRAKVLRQVPSGWRNNPSQFQRTRFSADDREISIEYRFDRGRLQLRIDGDERENVFFEIITDSQHRVSQADSTTYFSDRSAIQMEIAGVGRKYDVHQVGDTYYVDSPLGSSTLRELPRFAVPKDEAAAGSLVAPLPGVVNEVRVKPGETVSAGDVLLVIDSMKVFHWISAPLAGRVTEVRVETGTHVNSGAVLVVIEEC